MSIIERSTLVGMLGPRVSERYHISELYKLYGLDKPAIVTFARTMCDKSAIGIFLYEDSMSFIAYTGNQGVIIELSATNIERILNRASRIYRIDAPEYQETAYIICL